ncbi:hypothetical protein VQL36_03140 [Chengkuizengella sp. SCS-71B]|uniref:hypothetical protein n=1 Tax=Chengkuizengella sp. SCS-71B TaxID=3115290 RepID=UPI0032C23F24
MKKTMFLVLISLSLVIVGCSAENSIDKESEVSDLYNEIDSTMSAIERKHDFSGAVYVGMEGEEIYSKTFGMAD